MGNEEKESTNKLKQLLKTKVTTTFLFFQTIPYDINYVLEHIQCICTDEDLEDILIGTGNTEPNELSKTNMTFTSMNFDATNEDR